MRQIILLIVGLVAGAAGGVSVVNALRQRDAYPRGLMDVMQHHYASLRDDVRRGHCELSARHLDILRNLAAEIGDAVYGEDIPDSPFREYNTRLIGALDSPNSTDCRALAPQLQKIGATCDDCHRQYR
jgi:hypothetical protein